MDLSSALLETLVFERDDMWFYVSMVYLILPQFCYVCNSIGHMAVVCCSFDFNAKDSKKDQPILEPMVKKVDKSTALHWMNNKAAFLHGGVVTNAVVLVVGVA